MKDHLVAGWSFDLCSLGIGIFRSWRIAFFTRKICKETILPFKSEIVYGSGMDRNIVKIFNIFILYIDDVVTRGEVAKNKIFTVIGITMSVFVTIRAHNPILFAIRTLNDDIL